MATLTCISPIDGKTIATRETASATAIEAVVAAARVAQRDWARVPLGDRAQIMLAALEHLRAVNADVTMELARQMGRPVRYGCEFRSIEERVRHMVEIAPAALAPLQPAAKTGFRREIRRVPLGVVLVVAPWNYPYLTAVNTIVPGLMAGNAVLLKAASQTLLTGDRFQAAFDAAGLPKGLFQSLALSHDDTSKLISCGHIDHVSFTGSVAGGRSIEQAAAGTFASTTLELGGKDPAYVRADANLAHAVENLVDGAFFNSGQSCCGIERIYVHDKLYKAFVDGFAAETNKYVLADPLDSATTLGPMAATRFADVVRGQTSAAVAKGAKALIGRENFIKSKDGSPWLQPQVLVDVDHTMAVMTEESFGPVVGIMRVKDDAEAVRLMNDSAYGLTAAIWTADLDVASSLADQLDTGTVFANRCDYLDPALAWTGVKDTGRGVSLSSLAYGALTQAKSVHLRAV
jgi:acyl-CoA reductase-like NAD-dependent aldehyde dehydrogenase